MVKKSSEPWAMPTNTRRNGTTQNAATKALGFSHQIWLSAAESLDITPLSLFGERRLPCGGAALCRPSRELGSAPGSAFHELVIGATRSGHLKASCDPAASNQLEQTLVVRLQLVEQRTRGG